MLLWKLWGSKFLKKGKDRIHVEQDNSSSPTHFLFMTVRGIYTVLESRILKAELNWYALHRCLKLPFSVLTIEKATCNPFTTTSPITMEQARRTANNLFFMLHFLLFLPSFLLAFPLLLICRGSPAAPFAISPPQAGFRFCGCLRGSLGISCSLSHPSSIWQIIL